MGREIWEPVWFDIWCGKCHKDLVLSADQQWSFLRHLTGQCKTEPGQDNPPDWLRVIDRKE